MQKTKSKIIGSAIHLFNHSGLINVRLQHIADHCNISVGNLAYHYANKLAIIKVIDTSLQSELEPLFSDKFQFKHLIDFDNQLSQYYFHINKYAFYFLDMLELERNYPAIHKNRQRHILKMIDQIHAWLKHSQANGLLREELQPSQYRHTARAIWMLINFWMTQARITSSSHTNSEMSFKEVVWNQLLPAFTTAGLMEYEAIILPQLANYDGQFIGIMIS